MTFECTDCGIQSDEKPYRYFERDDWGKTHRLPDLRCAYCHDSWLKSLDDRDTTQQNEEPVCLNS